MKRQTTFFGIVLAALILSSCSAASPTPTAATPTTGPAPVYQIVSQPSPRTISVTGEGTVQVTPDIAQVSVGVESRDADISKAVDDNTTKTNAVIAAVKALGVKDADIQTNNFTLYWQEIISTTGQPTGEGRYVVNNTVSITVRDIPKLGQILGDSINAGANSVFGVSFTLEDPSAAIQQARDKAIADALAKANQYALGLHITVGKVLYVAEGGVTIPYPVEKGYAVGMGGGGAVPVSAGTAQVTVDVSVVFEIA